MPRLRSCIRGASVVYASGPYLAVLSIIIGSFLGVPVVVEVGDLRPIQVADGLRGWLARRVDRFFTQRCALLVSTTEQFISEYYRKWIRVTTPAITLENKVEKAYGQSVPSERRSVVPEGIPFRDRPLRIGYLGLLRCPWSWSVLRTLAERHGERFEVVLAGLPMDPADLVEQVASTKGVTYIGQFKSPSDLCRLYTSVDLVWACYQEIGPDDWNLRWARPNRFYESCLFQRPLVSRKGSCDSVDVAKFDIGHIVSGSDPIEVADLLTKVTVEDLNRWRVNMSNLPERVYAYTDEEQILKDAILRVTQIRA